jgi:hypothetical protein
MTQAEVVVHVERMALGKTGQHGFDPGQILVHQRDRHEVKATKRMDYLQVGEKKAVPLKIKLAALSCHEFL